MKKVFANREELAHVWAQQTHAEGKSGNMFFEGRAIYSYGHHFCIARFVDSQTVLFTIRDYSPTTAQHKSIVRNAITNKTVFYVPSGIDDNSKLSHEINLNYYADRLFGFLNSIKTAKTKGLYYYDCAIGESAQAEEYIRFFKLKETQHLKQAKIELAKIDRKELKAKQDQAFAKKHAKEIKKYESWPLNLDETIRASFYKLPVKLRIKNGFVETSRGARVELKEAEALYHTINAGFNVKGVKIGHYTVDRFENDTVVIGCHNIPLREADRIFTK